MISYNNNTIHSLHTPPSPAREGLEEIPEDEDLPGSHSTIDIDSISASQNLASENVVRWFEQGEGEDPSPEQKAPTKSRRKNPPGPDHVKHRRTRSGCYTCRARRIKCDEARPICERCRKGARECTWPPESASKSSASSKAAKVAENNTDSSVNDEEEEEPMPKDQRSDKEVAAGITGHGSSSSPKTGPRQQSRKNSKRSSDYIKEKSMSPTTTEDTRPDSGILSPIGIQSSVSTNTSYDDHLWSRLKHDHQFYLNYHQRSISHCYYFLKQDLCNFIETTLIDAALTYEPLLYAVVGFSAFQYALVHPGQKVSSFLGYYNKGVSLLRQDLSSGKPYTDAMVYTILQLATFEEYMGDWANLMIHQKAACELIKELYQPELMMQIDTHRMLFAWYIRFDIFVGFMAGAETLIGFEWFQAYHDSTKRLTMVHPDNIDYKLEALNAENLILSMHMAILFAKLPKGEITIEEFNEKNLILLHSIEVWSDQVRALRFHADHLVYEFRSQRPLVLEDIVDPFEPGVIFDSAFFSANYMLMDCLALEVMHKMQTSTVLQQLPPPELTDLSLQQCQIFEAMQEYEGAPNGAFLPAQVNIGLVCLFVPRDDRHISWCRKMLSRFENCGYIYPPSFRAKVAEGWSMPSIKKSWLPDDSQQPQIIKDLRSFIEERTTKPQTQLGEDIRAMKAVLEKLNLEESPKSSPESMSSTIGARISPSRSDSMNRVWNESQQTPWPRQQSGKDYYEMSPNSWT